MFIECLRRSAVKLECISAAIDRAIARAASSVGQNVSRPAFSARYSTIARLSHTTASPSHRIGTLPERSEEHTSELQSLMRISYAVFCLKKKNKPIDQTKEIEKKRATQQ